VHLLRVAMGALAGPLANIVPGDAPAAARPGAVSMGVHSVPFVNDYDPRSGDYGLGFFGISLEAAAYLVRDGDLPGGWACYLCNLAAGASATRAALAPVDGYRLRAYLEPLGLWLVAQAGTLASLDVDLAARSATVTFAPAGAARSYSTLRLAVSKPAGAARPAAASWVLADASGQPCPLVRGAFQLPPNADDAQPTTATLTWSA